MGMGDRVSARWGDEMSGDMISFSDSELAIMPAVKAGQRLHCKECGRRHELKAALNLKEGREETGLLTFRCCGLICLAAIKGRLVSPLLEVTK